MKIGLFFGSFNPIHIGHLAIANYFIEFSDLEKIWLVISPHNPLKERKSLLAENHRYQMAYRALENEWDIRPSNIEFKMPKPSYTIDTLAYLQEKYKNYQFVLIMGSDNLQTLHKWKNYKQLTDLYEIYVYPRHNTDIEKYKSMYNIKVVDAPLIEISSSFIRKAIREKKNIRYFLPDNLYEYIREMHFYEK